MMLNFNGLPASARVMLLALGLTCVTACEEETATNTVDENLQTLRAEGVLYGVRSYLTNRGIQSGEVVADSAYQFPDSSQTRMYRMEMTLYYEDGRDRARIDADSAILHQRTEELTAWGNVVARVMDRGATIETAELHYEPNAQQIWSDSATTISQDDGSVTRGTAFRSDLMFQNWELNNPVGVIPTGGGGTRDTTGVDSTAVGDSAVAPDSLDPDTAAAPDSAAAGDTAGTATPALIPDPVRTSPRPPVGTRR